MQINTVKLSKVVEEAKAKAASSPRWLAAIEKAAEQLRENPYIAAEGDGLLILSDSGKIYTSNGVCQCKAFEFKQPCWHRAAVQLVRRYREAYNFHPLAGVLVKSNGRTAMKLDGGWEV